MKDILELIVIAFLFFMLLLVCAAVFAICMLAVTPILVVVLAIPDLRKTILLAIRENADARNEASHA